MKTSTARQKETIKANTRFGDIPKQGISQLAALSRRIPRILSRHLHKLTSGKKLTPDEAKFHQNKVAGAHVAAGMLNQELINRNIGGLPFRDCTPHLKRGPGHKMTVPLMRAA